ncbi:hypothetical protein CEXT_462251 [Caerostris extrusa]|uniref:Uncharacterized protein n=1 Tax=Caerostris extrusa TaxID=172846 RepID=A0AAV4UKU7_CAEEX|nr:hypothetical protein CEXT_462251 [Caerostris extrusa]
MRERVFCASKRDQLLAELPCCPASASYENCLGPQKKQIELENLAYSHAFEFSKHIDDLTTHSYLQQRSIPFGILLPLAVELPKISPYNPQWRKSFAKYRLGRNVMKKTSQEKKEKKKGKNV